MTLSLSNWMIAENDLYFSVVSVFTGVSRLLFSLAVAVVEAVDGDAGVTTLVSSGVLGAVVGVEGVLLET